VCAFGERLAVPHDETLERVRKERVDARRAAVRSFFTGCELAARSDKRSGPR
jgi:hypothetical protein